jgi:hypothetical protein
VHFLEQTRKVDAMPESVVHELLQGPGREEVPCPITEGQGGKRERTRGG